MISLPEGYSLISQLSLNPLGYSLLIKNNKTEKIFVAKCILKDNFSSNLHFQNYCSYISSLNSIGIPQFLSFRKLFINDTNLFLIRPYLPFFTLDTFITNQTETDISQLLVLWKNIVIAYYGLSKKKVFPDLIHPSNIYLTSIANIIISDIYKLPNIHYSKYFKPKLSESSFLPPESIENKFIPNEKSLVWSLCNLLYFILTGKVLFFSKNLILTFKKILNGHEAVIENFSNLPKNISEIIISGINPNPNNRITLDNLLKQCIEIEKSQDIIKKSIIPSLSIQTINSTNLNDVYLIPKSYPLSSRSQKEDIDFFKIRRRTTYCYS